MVDFKSKIKNKEHDKKIHPVEIYDSLDRRTAAGPLRPAQIAILNEWFDSKKTEKDLIIKLHTGEGKTLIGLLILLSRINAGSGPCIYVCPSKYLVEQVAAEAVKFGIPYTTFGDERGIPDEFIDGKKILITNVMKIFNGKSVFGIDNLYVEAKSIILDDSHACIDSIKDTFTIKLDNGHPAYTQIRNLFEDDLKGQGEGSYLDIKNGEYDTLLPIPYWSWKDKLNQVLAIISTFKEDSKITFTWPIIKDNLENCQAFFTGKMLEISTYLSPTHLFGTWTAAEQRILMSATTQDDGYFIKGLGFSMNAVQSPLTNKNGLWSGEKLILIPSLIDDDLLDRTRIINSIAPPNTKRKYGRVVLTPSYAKADHYGNLKAKVASQSSIFNDITSLKNGEYSETLVLANRYDGIDLPDDACRVLVIDSLPVSLSLNDRYEVRCRASSDMMSIRTAQKIEQGLGRSVRGEKDYSAIILTGSDLVKFVRGSRTNKFFSPQTRKQIDIGILVSNDAKKDIDVDNPFKVVAGVISQVITRDPDWKEYYTDEMNTIVADPPKTALYEILKEEREAEYAFYHGQVEKAIDILQKAIDKHFPTDPIERGWYQQQLARYKYSLQKSESNIMQLSAFRQNHSLLKPESGITYTKMANISGQRIKRIKEYFSKHGTFAELNLNTNEMLDNMIFGPETADNFESSLQQLGELLGFESQRPDKEIKKGPDNLWGGTGNGFIFFECKSEVELEREEITKKEAGQMGSHSAWFEEEYGTDTQVSRILIIPTKNLSYFGNFTHEVTIMRREKLNNLKKNVKNFISEFKDYNINELADEKIHSLLIQHLLTPDDLKTKYSEKYIKRAK